MLNYAFLILPATRPTIAPKYGLFHLKY